MDDKEISLRMMVCVPHGGVIPDLVNFVELFTQNKEEKVLLHVARMLMVGDRESSILSATRSSMANLVMGVEEHFSKHEHITVSTDKIVGTPNQFPRDILELVHEYHINIIFYPWMADDSKDNIRDTLSALFHSSPATVGVFISAHSTPVLGFPGHGKIFIPFFGGENDREAVMFGVSLAGIVPVIIGIYSSATTIKSSECSGTENIHHQHAFTSAEDDEFLEAIKKKVDSKNSSITSVTRTYNLPEEALQALEQDLMENYSLVILGRSIMDGFDENTWTKVLGTVGAEYLERNIPSSYLILNKSKRSPKYVGLPVVELTESS